MYKQSYKDYGKWDEWKDWKQKNYWSTTPHNRNWSRDYSQSHMDIKDVGEAFQQIINENAAQARDQVSREYATICLELEKANQKLKRDRDELRSGMNKFREEANEFREENKRLKIDLDEYHERLSLAEERLQTAEFENLGRKVVPEENLDDNSSLKKPTDDEVVPELHDETTARETIDDEADKKSEGEHTSVSLDRRVTWKVDIEESDDSASEATFFDCQDF